MPKKLLAKNEPVVTCLNKSGGGGVDLVSPLNDVLDVNGDCVKLCVSTKN